MIITNERLVELTVETRFNWDGDVNDMTVRILGPKGKEYRVTGELADFLAVDALDALNDAMEGNDDAYDARKGEAA